MKMFKKLMAVVLTGVMAVSMLTGCALSDKQKAEALKGALNDTTGTVTKYSYDSDLNSKANRVYTKYLDGKYDNVAAYVSTSGYGSKKQTAETLAYSSDVDGYAFYVISAPAKKADKKAEWTTAQVTALDKAVKTGCDTGVTVAASTIKKVDGAVASASTTNKNKVKFGVKFVDNGKSGDNKDVYAIVVVKLEK